MKADIMDRQTLPDGHVIFREGQPATKLYLVAQGEVELYKVKKSGLEMCLSCQTGEFIGVNALIPQANYTATAKVKAGATIIPVEGAQVAAQLGKMDKLTTNVVLSVVKRLNRLLDEKCESLG